MPEAQDERNVHQAQEEVHELLKQIPTLCGQVGGLISSVEGLRKDVASVKSDLGGEIGRFRQENKEDHGEIKDAQKITNGNVSELQKWKERLEGAFMTIKVQWVAITAIAALAIAAWVKG
jgi:peptidoglycan hydrolase CwlO-like protein